MSALAQQLNKLRQSSVASIAPGAPLPTLLLDPSTARNTTLDVLYTMALLGYAEIKKQILRGGRSLAEQLLSEHNKQLNRNKLTKDENKALSMKLTRLMIVLSGLFLNRGCQAILEYLLRNYNVHVFQCEQLAVIFLQYWENPIYGRLVNNIQIKSTNLQFLKAWQEPKATINFAYILKSLSYSRSLVASLLLFVRKLIKEETSQYEQYEIELVSRRTGCQSKSIVQVEQSSVVKRDLKQFVLQVLCALVEKGSGEFDKEIGQFCIHAANQEDENVYSMSMILSLALLTKQKQHSGWINRIMATLVGKSVGLSLNIFNFLMVIWQRWPSLVTHQLIDILLQKQHFMLHITDFNGSLNVPFYMLFQHLLYTSQSRNDVANKGIVLQLLRSMCLKVKEEQFVTIHENSYYTQIFIMLHDNVDKIQSKVKFALQKFIEELLAYEYAIFVEEKKIAPISGIFGKHQIKKNGSIDWNTLKKVRKQRKMEEKFEAEIQVESESEEEQMLRRPTSLMTVFSTHLQTPIESLSPLTAKIKQVAVHLLRNYYAEEDSELSKEGKNKILEEGQLFSQLYNNDWFYFDLQHRDYHTAIRYLMKQGDVEMCYRVLEPMSKDLEVAEDMLYRQMCRQATGKLADLAQHHYKSVVNILGRLYHHYCKNTHPDLTKPLNQAMLRLSSSVLLKAGRQKGKFYKLIACHSEFLAALTISSVHAQQYALQTYLKLVQIFGTQNQYCLVIGVAEILATKVRNKKLFGDFIDKILIPAIRRSNEQSSEYKAWLNLLTTVHKCLTFSRHMLETSKDNAQQKEDLRQNGEPVLDAGVAKKMITNFFGLTSQKSRRSIVRKIFLFLSSLFKSSEVGSLFRQALTTITKKQELKLCLMSSNIVSLLIKTSHRTSGPLKAVNDNIKTNLLKLFPLELKIDVLGPLLPMKEVYLELGSGLAQNTTNKFDNLYYFVNVVPPEASNEWSKFVTECLKRYYVPKEEVCRQVLQLYTPTLDNNTNIVKFICAMSQHARQECLPLLPTMMGLIFQETKEPNSYALAIFHKLTTNLKQFIHPYLGQIFKIAIEVSDSHVTDFIDGIVSAFTAPTLVQLVKSHSKSVSNTDNFSYFLNKISDKVSYESVWKTCQSFFSRSLAAKIQNQEQYFSMQDNQAEVFMSQALKMNENQLRKVIIDYVRWSSQRTNSDQAAGLIFNSRKNLLMIIFQRLSQKLGDLFTHFFGYVFEDIVKDLEGLKVMESGNKHTGREQKRDRQVSEYCVQCTAEYTKQMLLALKELLEHDPTNQFMDAMRFDSVCPWLCNIFNLTGFNSHYGELIEGSLQPCLDSLFRSTRDDYKLKTVNTEILRLVRTKDQRVLLSIFGFYDSIIGQLDYRFLLFSDEMIPLLIEASSSRSAGVKKLADSLIAKIQNLSGQKIDRISRR